MKRSPLHAACALFLSGIATSAIAQQAPEGEKKTQAMEAVIVTGTKVQDRTVAESLSAIDIITPEALQSTGTTELATALSRAVPSLNFPRPAITDGTDAVRPAQLRGMAPDQVLVLVNGKRRHVGALINLNGSQGRGSEPVDINAIPIAAVERVEVLRDGAAAQYGSDAIAGVINIVLKSGNKHGSFAGQVGQYSAGDGFQGQLLGDMGFALGERGSIHLAAQALSQDQTNRARPYITGPGQPTFAADAMPGQVVNRLGDPKIDQEAISYNGNYKITDGIEFYSFGMASNRDALSNGFYRTAKNSRNIPEVYPNGFLPQIDNYSKDRSLVAGLKGRTENGWNWDLSYDYGTNHLSFDVLHSLNRSIGPSSQHDFYAGALETTQNVFNADVSRDFDFGWHSPVTLAFGTEYRSDKFNQSPGEPNSYIAGPLAGQPPGAQVFSGFKPTDAGHYDRDSYSVYADAEGSFSDQLSYGAAVRYEHYSDFGSTTSGKLSGRYAFTDTFALRATASSGFRAPSLAQQFFQSTATNFIGGIPFDVRTFAVTNPVAIALGAEPLKPEKSINYSLGFVAQPLDGLSLTLDAYQIKVTDRIILSENLIGAAVTNFLAGRGYPGVTGGRYFTNAIDTRTRGVDLVGSYRFELGPGEMTLTGGYNRNKTVILAIAPNPPQLTQGGLNLLRIGRTEQGRVTCGAPKDKFSLASAYNVSSWTFNAAATRYGSFCVLQTNPAIDQHFGPQWTLDVSATYHLNERLDFTLGADNATNSYPDEVRYENSTNGQAPYSSASPAGFNGAYVYGKATFHW
ncbi:TonB-dependent receptor [Rudaea sp.]|uniref:TonB-dependent receptor plug domain-containing protein n=1 Tax=Rudaea sp. TaxID=2136325 RepID=UPI002ED4130A